MVFGLNLFASSSVDIKTALKMNVFFPGNVVEGVVHITTTADVEFTAVRLKICGKEKVHLIEKSTDSEGEVTTTHHRESNVVYKQLLTLAGEMKTFNSNQSHTLPAGTYYYPFSWQLPNDLPPSFSKQVDDDHAEVFYYCKAYVAIPRGKDAVNKTFFSLLRPIPQSQWVHRAPATVQRHFDVTCCCCISKGAVDAHIFMDRTIIAIDRDHLQIFAHIDNSGGENPVESLEVTLRRKVVYKARGHCERDTSRVGHQFIRNGVAAGAVGDIQGKIDLPRDTLPTITTPNVTVAYEIQIELNIPMASDPSQTFPVIIAQSVDESNYAPPMQFNQCSYRIFNKGDCPEFYYQPPQNPVYQVQMIPMMQPPPNIQFMAPPMISVGLPSASWVQGAQPPTYNGQPMPNQYGNQYQWGDGADQTQMANFQMGPAPPPMVLEVNMTGGGGASYGAVSSPTLPQQSYNEPEEL